jgi:hypothetical protein
MGGDSIWLGKYRVKTKNDASQTTATFGLLGIAGVIQKAQKSRQAVAPVDSRKLGFPA